MTTIKQLNTSGGELSPSLHSRVDISKYQAGFKTLRNVTVRKDGSISNRHGGECTSEAPLEDGVVVIPFEVEGQDDLGIEISDLKIRILKNGKPVTDGNIRNISAITTATPSVFTYTGPTLSITAGDELSITDIKELPMLDGRQFEVISHNLGTKEFTVSYHGVPFTISGLGTYAGGGLVSRNYVIDSPYESYAIPFIDYGQSIDVMTLVHPDYDPTELTMNAYPDDWDLNTVVFPVGGPPGDIAGLSGLYSGPGGTVKQYNYAVTSIDPVTGEESLDYNTGPVNVVEPLGLTAYVQLRWATAVAGTTCNIYRLYNGVYGLIGVMKVSNTLGVVDQYRDIGVTPDTTSSLVSYFNPFAGADGRPAAFTYFQQRTVYAGPNKNRELVTASRLNFYNKFVKRTPPDPIRDSDSLEFALSGSRINPVHYLLDLNGLIMFTANSEQYLGNGAITPSSISPQAQSYNGCKRGLKPLTLDSTALYVQRSGSIIRELGFQYESDGYRGDDLTIFSSHLFKNKQIVSWCYQKNPDSQVWIVLDDGTMVSMTYVKEQNILALSPQSTEDGFIEKVYCLRENELDIVYTITIRNGRRYHERHIPRNVSAGRFLDSYVESIDEPLAGTTVTLSADVPGAWAHGDVLTATFSYPYVSTYFKDAPVGSEVHIYTDSGPIKLTVLVATPMASTLTVTPSRTIPLELRDTPTEKYSFTHKTVYGLEHLEGKKVSVFADGAVIASVHNDSYNEEYTVENGRITLSRYYANIAVGLPITADVETLDIDTAQGVPLTDRSKLIGGVTLQVDETRGLFAGGSKPVGDDYLKNLDEFKTRQDETYGEPNRLISGKMEVNFPAHWNSNGRVFIRQTEPLPFTILSILPSGKIPFGG